MAQFNVFAVGFDNFNETVNFGNRLIDTSTLYEICTLATIKSSSSKLQNEKPKIVFYYGQKGEICIGVNNILRIITDKEKPISKLEQTFNSSLDAVALSACSSYFIVCLKNGEIFIEKVTDDIENADCTLIYNESSVVYNEKIKSVSSGDTGNVFRGIYSDSAGKTPKFFIVTIEGLILSIYLSEKENKFKSEILYDFKSFINKCEYSYPYLCLCNDEKIIIFDLESNEFEDDSGIKNVKYLNAVGQNFLATDSDSNYYLINSLNCLVFNANEKYNHLKNTFSNFFIGNDGKDNFVVGISENNGISSIQAFPSLFESASIYKVPLENISIYLIKSDTEEALFISEIYKNNNLTELRLQSVTTCDPELRVKKLVQKGQIEQAEIFADLFNVNNNIILEFKVSDLISKYACDQNETDQLLALFDKINDSVFILQCCDAVKCYNSLDMKKILFYAAHLNVSKDADDETEIRKLKKHFGFLLRRFDTYLKLYDEYDINEWQRFAECSIIEEIKKFLIRGFIEKATVLVVAEIYHEFIQEQEITEVLEALNSDLSNVLTFLNAFIPRALKCVPSSYEYLVGWVCRETSEMEMNRDFPQYAIKFLDDTSKLFSYVSRVVANDFQESILDLKNTLEGIEILNDNFSMQVTLSSLKEHKSLVSALLNRQWESSKLELLITQFIQPYLVKCGQQLDEVLENEIKKFFKFEEKYWIDTVNVLIKFIKNVETKLNLIKDILAVAKLPYSIKIKNIANLALEYANTHKDAKYILKMLRGEGKLLLFQKYNININFYESWDETEFYLNRILYLNRENYDTAYKDIHNLFDETDYLKIDCFIFKEFIKNGYPGTLNLLDSLDAKYFKLLGQNLLKFIFIARDTYLNMPSIRKNLHEALFPLWNRLNRLENTVMEKRQISSDYAIAKAAYGIYNDYRIVVCDNVTFGQAKKKFLNQLINVVKNLMEAEGDTKLEKLFYHCRKLSNYFDEPLEAILIKFLHTDNNFEIFLNICEYMLDTSESANLLTKCSVNLLQFTDSKEETFDLENVTFLDVAAIDSNNAPIDKNDKRAIDLAHKLCVKALLNFKDDGTSSLSAIIEVLQCIDYCHYSTDFRKDLRIKEEVYKYYIPSIMENPINLSHYIKIFFNIYNVVEDLELKEGQLTYFKSNELVSIRQIKVDIENFICNTHKLIEQGQIFAVFNMINLLQQICLISNNCKKEIFREPLKRFILQTVLPEMIQAVLTHKFVDKNLLFDLMLFYDKTTCLENIKIMMKTYKNDPRKIRCITQISVELVKFHKAEEHLISCINFISNASKWWLKVHDEKMSYRTFFSINKSNSLFKFLIECGKLKIEHLKEFCLDFDLDLGKTYIRYLKLILLTWHPEAEINTDLYGIKSLIIKNTEEKLTKDCLNIINCISDKYQILILQLIDDIFPSINHYYYEVHGTLLFLRKKIDPTDKFADKYLPLLNFLKSYQRINEPSTYEVDSSNFNPFINNSNNEANDLPKFRLPLRDCYFTSDIWNLVKPEVSLSNYEEWFEFSDMFPDYLKIDDICTYAINSPLLDRTFSSNQSEKWNLTSKYDKLLEKVVECLAYIKDFERATAAVYSLMEKMPPGIDKVTAAKISLNSAEAYYENNPREDVRQIYEKVKGKFYNYSALEILHKYQLADKKYVDLVSQPLVLLNALYNDERIELFFDNLVLKIPDINGAAQELGDLFIENFKEEKKNILKNLLEEPSPLDFHFQCMKNLNLNLKRAYYLCQCEDLEYLQNFLMESRENQEKWSFTANSLLCFYYISDSDAIEKLTDSSIEEFIIHVDKVCLIAKLNDLGIRYSSVEELNKENPKLLMKKLGKMYNNCSVKCIALLSKIYGLEDIKYWDYIIKVASQYNMIKELRDYLEHLEDNNINVITKNAWTKVLTVSFNNINWATLRESDVFDLFQNCPIYELDLEAYIESALRNNRSDIAKILRGFCKSI